MNGVLINDTVLVFAFVIGITAFGMFAEKKWKWAGILSGMGVSIFTALFLVTFRILPTASPAYDVVFDYVMPVAIPMVLVQANAERIIKESGRSFILMNVACIGALLGGIAIGFIFQNNAFFAEDLAGYVAMEVGVCTGGTMNQAAMAQTFNVSSDVASAAAVGSNLVAVCFLVVIGLIPNVPFFKKHYKHPHIDELEQEESLSTVEVTEQDEQGKYTIFGFAKLLVFAFGIYGVSVLFCNFMGTFAMPSAISMMLTNTFLISSVLTLVIVTLFPRFAASLRFGEEIGSFLLLMFMTVMGAGASIIEVLKIAPLIVVAEIIVLFFIIGITLGFAKIFKMNLEEALIAINASYGGPSTACAYVGQRRWKRLMVPAVLIGVYGYIVGNVFGIIAGNVFL